MFIHIIFVIVMATVPASQSEVTVMQSEDDNHSRQDDESNQADHTGTNGLYISSYMCVGFLLLYHWFDKIFQIKSVCECLKFLHYY